MRLTKRGFTLIEILLAVVVLGVISSISLAFINPKGMVQRANEGVMRSNLAQVAKAVAVCQTSQPRINAEKCDSFNEVGVVEPATPKNANYWIGTNLGQATTPRGFVQVSASLGNCYMTSKVQNTLRSWTSDHIRHQSGGVHVDVGCLTE